MRGFYRLAGLAALALAMPTFAAAAVGPAAIEVCAPTRRAVPSRVIQPGRKYRNRAEQARPKRRRNLVTLSRRVRRRHRRARK